MLTACASSGAKTPPPTAEPDPVIEVRYETRTVCPPELRQALPARPAVPADAVVQANEIGGRWLASDMAWSSSVAARFLDAQAACPAEVLP
ncbi:hypothetical protein D3C71_314640 [compost metagenome]